MTFPWQRRTGVKQLATQGGAKRGFPGPLLGLLFILAALAPLGAAHFTGVENRTALREFGTALGLTAAGLLFLQFLSSGRFETLSGRIGIDRTMGFHRIAAYFLLLFAVLHPLAYVAGTALTDPSAALRRLIGMLTSPRLATGVAALVLLALLVTFAVFRERVNIAYEYWRASHSVMAAAVTGLTLHHTLTTGKYSPESPLLAVWIGYTAVALATLLTLYFIRPWRMWRQGWRIDKVTALGDRAWEITLRAPETAHFTYRPGQFIWVAMAPNRPPFHDHPFSIASAPGEFPRLRLIVRESGNCTNNFGRLQPGTPVAVDGPHGSFTLGAEGKTVLMVAGGVGIAPLVGMLEQAAATKDPRAFCLLYAARKPSELAGIERLRELQSLINLQIHYFVDAGAHEPRFAQGPVGFRQLAEVVGPAAHDVVAYVCGPSRMMEETTDALLDLRIPAEAIHYERFNFSAGRSRLDRTRTQRVLFLFALVIGGMLAFSAR